MNGFIRIGRTDDIPLLEGRTAAIGSRRVAIFRTADGFHALGALCPHAGGPLADGLVADNCVTCPLHNRRFDLRSGAAIGHHEGVDAYDVVVMDGELWLRAPAELECAA